MSWQLRGGGTPNGTRAQILNGRLGTFPTEVCRFLFNPLNPLQAAGTLFSISKVASELPEGEKAPGPLAKSESKADVKPGKKKK